MVVRELVTLLGFRVNEAQLRRAELRMKTSAMNMAMIGRNMTMFVTLPIALAAKAFIGAASHVQLLSISLATMLGDAKKAQIFMKDLFQFAKETPLFQIEEIGNQAKRLLAVGFAAKDVIPNLRMLGDIAAGVNVPLQRIVLNYSQVRAQGKLTGRELRDFAVAGVPLLDALSKATGKSTQEIFGMIRSSKIPFAMVQKAFRDMTNEGGIFANLMERMADTTKGRFLKFLDNIFLLRVEIGSRLLPIADKLIEFFDKVIGFIRNLDTDHKRFITIVAAVAALAGPLFLIIKLVMLLLGPMKLLLAALAGISLIIDDVRVWQRDGESVLGRLLGKYEEFAKKWIRITGEIREANKAPFLTEEQIEAQRSVLDKLLRFTKQVSKEILKGVKERIADLLDFIDTVKFKIIDTIELIKNLLDFKGLDFDSDIAFVNLFRGIKRLVSNVNRERAIAGADFGESPRQRLNRLAATAIPAGTRGAGVGTVLSYNPINYFTFDKVNMNKEEAVEMVNEANNKAYRDTLANVENPEVD